MPSSKIKSNFYNSFIIPKKRPSCILNNNSYKVQLKYNMTIAK